MRWKTGKSPIGEVVLLSSSGMGAARYRSNWAHFTQKDSEWAAELMRGIRYVRYGRKFLTGKSWE